MTTHQLACLICILAACCTRCAPRSDAFALHGESPDERDIVLAAMAEWCDVSGDLCPTLDDHAPNSLTIVDDLGGHLGVTHDDGLTEVSSIRIWRRPGATAEEIEYTVAHELGHHFGCVGHYTDANVHNLMAQNYTGADWQITTADLTCARGASIRQ